MTKIEELLVSRGHAPKGSKFTWFPFPDESLDGNDVIYEGEVTFPNGETHRCRADKSQYTGEITFTNVY